jgi:hypothetical protein
MKVWRLSGVSSPPSVLILVPNLKIEKNIVFSIFLLDNLGWALTDLALCTEYYSSAISSIAAAWLKGRKGNSSSEHERPMHCRLNIGKTNLE